MKNLKRRPYGLSYDGKPSTRKLIKYLHPCSGERKSTIGSLPNQFSNTIKIENIESSPQATNLFQLSKDEEEVVSQDNFPKPSKDNEKVRKELNYISKFLNFQHHMKQNSESSFDQEETKIRMLHKLGSQIEDIHEIQRRINKIKQQSTILETKSADQKYQTILRCACGKEYRNQLYLMKHIENKHNGKEPELSKESKKFQKKKKIKICINWLFRICENLQKLNFSIEELDQLVGDNYQIYIQLNTNIESEKVFLDFFESFHHSYAKISILYLMLELRKFFKSNEQFQKIWILDFMNFPLIANPFYGWLVNQKKQTQISKRPKYTEFISQMFLLFNHWSYANQLSEILLVRNSKQDNSPQS